MKYLLNLNPKVQSSGTAAKNATTLQVYNHRFGPIRGFPILFPTLRMQTIIYDTAMLFEIKHHPKKKNKKK
jgi:hypothetical protein